MERRRFAAVAVAAVAALAFAGSQVQLAQAAAPGPVSSVASQFPGVSVTSGSSTLPQANGRAPRNLVKPPATTLSQASTPGDKACSAPEGGKEICVTSGSKTAGLVKPPVTKRSAVVPNTVQDPPADCASGSWYDRFYECENYVDGNAAVIDGDTGEVLASADFNYILYA